MWTGPISASGRWPMVRGAMRRARSPPAMIASSLQAIRSGLSASDCSRRSASRWTNAHRLARGGGAPWSGCAGGLDRRGDAGARRSFRLPVGGRLARLSAARRASRQITRDHSLVQELLEAGAIGEKEAINHPRGNVITRAVGAEIDLLELEKRPGCCGPRSFLLCSDGLCKTLPERPLASCFRR